jgi:hypothetical protein
MKMDEYLYRMKESLQELPVVILLNQVFENFYKIKERRVKENRNTKIEPEKPCEQSPSFSVCPAFSLTDSFLFVFLQALLSFVGRHGK